MRTLSTVSTLVILLSTVTFPDVTAPAARAAAWKSDLAHELAAGEPQWYMN